VGAAGRALPDPVPPCAAFGEVPRVAVGTAARLVGHHCAHLGITVDDMAAALETEQ
jgi:hypothetical protein